MVFRRIPLLLTVIFLLVSASLTADSWSATAASHRGQNRSRFRYACGARGTVGKVWGTNLYTDDSSVCTAAVHAGALDPDEGGSVVIEIRPGARVYAGSLRNGIRSGNYDSWSGSFIFITDGTRARESERDSGRGTGARRIDWSTNASSQRGAVGQRFTLDCPNGGSPHNIWGTETYTDDSSVCTAAVHHGLIGWEGGRVMIEILPGRQSYRGSRSNGVDSEDYGRWTGSFVFVSR